MKITTRVILCLTLFTATCAAKKGGPIWTDPDKAAKENPDFLVQGEYAGKGNGVQVIALGKGRFHASIYKGGLPGAGWDRSAIGQESGDAAAMKKLTDGLERTERKSPTLGAKPPKGSVVLFDGTNADAWKNGKVSDGMLEAGTESKEHFGDFQLHLEFRTPFKPESTPSSQDRGNSGVYTFGRYETQILDSFGLDFDTNAWKKEKPKSHPKQWCGCFYKFKLADTNMCLPPLAWQTYDIDFTAPKFEGDKKVANARMTVRHNGVKIHDDVELPKGTGAGGGKKEIAKGPIQLQGHGNPVRFRNIWIVEKK